MREEPSPETTAEIEDALRTGSTRHLAAKGQANNPTEKERAVDALLKEAGLTSTAEDQTSVRSAARCLRVWDQEPVPREDHPDRKAADHRGGTDHGNVEGKPPSNE